MLGLALGADVNDLHSVQGAAASLAVAIGAAAVVARGELVAGHATLAWLATSDIITARPTAAASRRGTALPTALCADVFVIHDQSQSIGKSWSRAHWSTLRRTAPLNWRSW